jgi:chromosome segregation ATPase
MSDAAPPEPPFGPPAPNRGTHTPADPRSGPLAEVLLKQTVCALRAELDERAVGSAQLRGALADAQAELEARTATQARLEATHGDLRRELQELMGLVEKESARRAQCESEAEVMRVRVGELEQELAERGAELSELQVSLAASTISRDAAVSEASGLRAELDRLGTELARAREHAGSHAGELAEAQTLLSDARALSAQLRERQEPTGRGSPERPSG